MMIKDMKFLIINLIIVTIVILSGVGCIVYATSFGNELVALGAGPTDKYNEGYSEDATYNIEMQYTYASEGHNAWSIDRILSTLNSNFSDTTTPRDAELAFEAFLSQCGSAFCIQHGAAIPNGGSKSDVSGRSSGWYQFQPPHGTLVNVSKYISSSGNTYSEGMYTSSDIPKNGYFSPDSDDHADTSTFTTQTNNKAVILANGNLKNVGSVTINSHSNFVTYSNVAPYAATFADKWDGTQYNDTSAQKAIWNVAGPTGAEATDLYYAGLAVDCLENELTAHGDRPEVTMKDSEQPGAVYLEGTDTYRVGPFHMSDYAYIYSPYVINYSGKNLSDYKGLVGGIEKGEVILSDDNGNENPLEIGKNGVNIVYEDFYGKLTDGGKRDRKSPTGIYTDYLPQDYAVYPYPESTFYIDIPRNLTYGDDSKNRTDDDKTTLSKLQFTYRKTTTDGSVTSFVVAACLTTWTREEDGAACSNALCQSHYQTPGHCTSSCTTDDDGNTDHDDCDGPAYYCSAHHHNNCHYSKWVGSTHAVKGQAGGAINDSNVTIWNKKCISELNVRLTTDIVIKKYVEKVEHETNKYQTFGNTSSSSVKNSTQNPDIRKNMNNDGRKNDPIYAEYGDVITFRIDIMNNQNYRVKLKLKDILPKEIDVFSRTYKTDSNRLWKDYQWISVDGNDTTSLLLTLRTNANDDKLYYNEIVIVTRNSSLDKNEDDNVDFIRTEDRRVGPVVNISEIDSNKIQDEYGTNIPEDIFSIEYYKINDYNVVIDKYISDYKHEMMDTNNDEKITSETFASDKLEESDDPTNKPERFEKKDIDKQHYPVPVESTETLTYSVRIINNSTKNGNKVATEIRPQTIKDKLNKGLEFVKDGSGYKINAEIHNDVGTDKESNISLTQGVDYEVKYDSSKNSIDIELKDTQNGAKTDKNATYLVIQPGGYLLYEIEVKVIESNMNLNILENTASIEIMNNINNGKDRTGNTVACNDCQGTGNIYEYQTCGICGGSGTASKEGYCSNCSGRGLIYIHTNCDQCSGQGRVLRDENIKNLSDVLVYKCKKCNTMHIEKPSSTCDAEIPNIVCNNTRFNTICNKCGKKQGECEHVVWICSSGHKTHKGDNSNITKCGYEETHTDFKHYYKCSEKGCTYSEWNIDKCIHHANAKLICIKSICKDCGSEYTTKTTSHTWTCDNSTTKYCNSSSHGLKEYADCKHFKYECTKCKKKYANYPNKPSSCSNCYTNKCTSKDFEKTKINLNDITQDEYQFAIDALYKDCTKCGGTGYFEQHNTCTACSGGKNSAGTITCSTCEGRGKSIIATSKPCTNGCSNGRKPDTETSNRIVRNKTWYSGIDSNKKDVNRNMYAYKIPSEYVDYRNTPYVDYDGDGDNEISSDYVRMKDLVISGYVWLDTNRDGLMNEQNIDDQNQAYYNVNGNGAKENVVVRLYSVINNTPKLIRTTRTDERGRYTFSNYYSAPNTLTWYKTYKSESFENYADVGSRPDGNSNVAGIAGTNTKPYLTNSKDDLEHTTQRIDKATDKDEYGNYTNSSKFIDYYIEFEYDGVIYKSTEYYAGMDNLIDTQGDTYGKMIDPDKIYMKDSNAAEFNDVRENFNKSYQYISYDVGYSSQGQEYTGNDPKKKLNQTISEEDGSITFGEVSDDVGNPLTTADLMFDKTNHTSQLVENQNRAMTARSFIKNKTVKDLGNGNPNGWTNNEIKNNSIDNTNLLWLFNYRDEYQKEDRTYIMPNSSGANPKHTTKFNKNNPDTEYLKYINLGLELRENVDITLTKDVYSVNTLINGEDMEYFFNQNRAFNAEVGDKKGSYLNDYIITKAYGLELYESDYKMRVDQYAAEAVKQYKGINGESELNTEVTYRITVANKAINDDESLNSGNTKDTKLKVRISEILDLYDTNFKKYNSDADVVNVKKKDPNGYLVDGTIKVAEAWYFEQKDDGEYIIANDGKIPGTYEEGHQSTEKPVYIKVSSIDQETIGDKPRYTKHMLTLSNTSMKGNGVSNKENRNNFETDGYYTLYITGMENDNNLILEEGKDFDIYVKYVVDKTDSETTLTTDDYEDTINDKATTEDGKVVDVKGTERGNSAILKRTLKILDRIDKPEDTRRGLEGIAQVNMYSVWYADSGKATGLVDMDSNAGNLGNSNSNLKDKLSAKEAKDSTKKNEILNKYKHETKPSDQTSADTWNPYYEDMTYKTGIVITAEGSELNKQKVREIYGELEIQDEKMIRELTGRVWDDSRTEPGESENPTANDVQYMANGIYSKKDEKHNRALTNGNVPEEYKNPDAIEGQKTEVVEETKDLKVRSAKAELVEIVEIPTSEGSHYYEEILSNVTWEQAQHIRTNTKGDYKLKGFIPGKYVVRFTYGDTVDEVTSEEVRFITGKGQDTAISQDEKESTATSVAKDMQIFNGQDYKTTKYAYDLSSDYTTDSISVDSPAGTDPVANLAVKTGTIDQYAAGKLSESGEVSNNDIVMLALERPDLSDARDDEVRRLEVNSYSEIMVNQKAEILKGLANSSDLTTRTLKYQDEKDDDALKVNYYKEYEEEQYRNDYAQSLRSLTDSTNMNAETVEFLVKPEKLTYKQTNEETYYTKLKLNNKDYYYNDLDTIVHNIITERKYKIENIDMGIEYRPETNISLTKEISNIIVETSDGEQIANLALETEYKQEGNIMKPIHRVDMEHSIGADKVQFISNTYEVDPLLANIVDVHEETQQGFIYIAVDEEILQGCKVTVQYKFIAQNNSEVDKISQNLNSIRFYANNATKAYAEKYATIATGDSVSDYGNNSNGKISLYKIFDKYGVDTQKVEYTANNFARAIVQDDVYKKDANNSTYRNRAKTMTKDSVNKKDQITDGYYGNFVGYTYYIGRDNYTLDTIAEMKFDKIIDYVDTDLEFEQLLQYDKSTMTSTSTSTENTSGLSNALTNEQAIKDNKATINQSWSAPVAEAFAKIDNDPKVLVQIMNDMREDLFMLDSPWSLFRNFIGQYDKEDIEAAIKDVVSNPLKQAMLVDALQETFTDMNGIQYKSLVMTLADKVSDNAEDENKNSNKAFSKFLLPRTVAEKNGKQSEDKDTSKAIVYLPVSKVLATETDTENMLYENIAEVIQFTVLTGRRTNFDTTIGNADIHKVDKQSKNPEEYNLGKKPVDYEKFGSIEFVTAALEKDTSSTETITLTPPTGLMKNRRAIYETMETTRDVLKITVIAVTVVIITIGVTKFTMVKIKKRRYK